MDRMNADTLAREEAMLEKRLRRLEADVALIAAATHPNGPSGRAQSTTGDFDYLAALVGDVAAAEAHFARAAAGEQEPVLAAVTLRATARWDELGAAASQVSVPLERWWQQLLVERCIANDYRRVDGSYDGHSLHLSTWHNGTAAQLSLSSSTVLDDGSTWYALSCDLSGLLPVRDLERAANRLLVEPGGGDLVEFLTAHVWPALERACHTQSDRQNSTDSCKAVEDDAALHMVKEAQTEASAALAKAKALLQQSRMAPTPSTVEISPASPVHSSSHPAHVDLGSCGHATQDHRRPVPPPANGRHGARRQYRPTPLQSDDTVARDNLADGKSIGEAQAGVPTTPPTPSNPPTPGTPPPSPANRRPKRPPSTASAPRDAPPTGRSRPPTQQLPLPVPDVVPPQAADYAECTKLLDSLASLRSPGRLCDRFKVGSVLGTGQSTVRHAICNETGREYAVKYIRKDLDRVSTVSMLQELVTECTLMTRLHGQPNILQLAGVFESQSCYEIVTEYCPGGDLFGILIDRVQASDTIQVKGALSTPEPLFTEKEAAATMRQVIQGVAACHANGIAHRDLKPENVLLRQSSIVLADFGLAADCSSGPLFQSCGTAEFVAPEVLRASSGGYNQSCDIWSLGVLLYILICGYPPFQTMAELLQLREDAPLRFPHDEWATVSETAVALIRSMLDRRPENRPKATELLEHPWLCGSVDGMSHATLPSHAFTNLRRWNAKRKLRSCMLALIADRRLKGLVAGLSVEALIVQIAVERSLADVIVLCHCFRRALESRAVVNGTLTSQHRDSATEIDRPTFIEVVSREWQNGLALSPSLAAEHFDAYFSMHSLKFRLRSQHGQGNKIEEKQDTEINRGGGGESINWKGFCLALASLLPGVEKKDKLKFAFDLFDEDSSGSIDETEFASMIRCLLVGKCIETESLDVILQAEFEVADASNDGTIDLQEFVTACDHCPTIRTYFESLEKLSVHTLSKLQACNFACTPVQTAPTAITAHPAQPTAQPAAQVKDEYDTRSSSANDEEDSFESVLDEEPPVLAMAMAVAFEQALVHTKDDVDKANDEVDKALEDL